MKKVMIHRIGLQKQNNNGSNMTIIKYNGCKNILVEFDNGYITSTTYSDFNRGKVRNVYDKTFYNIGYIGEGNYNLTANRVLTKAGEHWHSMLNRCYNNKTVQRYPTYKDCTVFESWHNFQSFAKWFEENYYEIENETMDLDKDILIKNNTFYSPSTCIFVPHTINMIFTKRTKANNNLPTGIRIINRNKLYNARYNNIHLGCFYTVEEAFHVYKQFKENRIMEIADKYKNKIPQKLYDALYNYKVEMTD